MIELSVDIPGIKDEMEIYQRMDRLERDGSTDVSVASVVSLEQLQAIRKEVQSVQIERSVLEYGHELIQATRAGENILYGASVRAGMQFFSASKALAMVRGRTFVLPDDLRDLAVPALAHRLVYSDGARDSHAKETWIQSIVERIRPPK